MEYLPISPKQPPPGLRTPKPTTSITMSSLFDFEPQVDAYAVMGNPIAHSKSPQIHAAFAQQTKQSIIYDAMQVDVGGLPQAVGNFVANGGKGLNITVPFKTDAFKLVDQLTPRAQLAGAVNTIVVQADGALLGDNTDGVGLTRDLSLNHGVALRNKRILLIGAGGAARGVVEPLLSHKPANLTICNRTLKRAQDLVLDFAETGECRACTFDNVVDRNGNETFDILINATSASLHGEVPALPDRSVGPASVCYDMMYGKDPTPFMLWSEKLGAEKSLDGLGMLVEQAAESFFIWRNVRPETNSVIALLRQSL